MINIAFKQIWTFILFIFNVFKFFIFFTCVSNQFIGNFYFNYIVFLLKNSFDMLLERNVSAIKYLQ